jgi:hypothetical protein
VHAQRVTWEPTAVSFGALSAAAGDDDGDGGDDAESEQVRG